ncbi:MAG TPA: hypothetical protein V6D48_17155 [Oculatellaceae cyanobacterium]
MDDLDPANVEYWLNQDDDEPVDEFEEWFGGRCGFIPEFGTCTLAGSEECDWECPLRDGFYQIARKQR